jgi:hypothetical protein
MNRREFAGLLGAALAPGVSFTDDLRPVAARLIGVAMTDEGGWRKLAYLCDRIGHRLCGSPALEQAIEWAVRKMKSEGLDNVQTVPAKVPHWVRGEESAIQLEPIAVPLAMLGLGGSVGTPPEGITAEVVAVSSFDELESLGADKVKGKMVLYAVPWQGYGRTVRYRTEGAVRAARLGAVASLVRSMTGTSLRTPHTGAMRYQDGVERIPSAAVSVEDAERMARLCRDGVRVGVKLVMGAQRLPDADSADVLGEIRGSERPEEIIVLGGHLDSWDVGQGAQDDGVGATASWQAVTLIKQEGLRPKRTLRAVLWVDEEQSGRGAEAYAKWAGETVRNHVAAIEMDSGSEHPAGFGLTLPGAAPEVQERGLARAREITALLEGLGASQVNSGGGGADISPLMRLGVPGFGHRTTGEKYFQWHHTQADTLDKVDREEFRMNIATLAVLAWGLSEMPGRLAS